MASIAFIGADSMVFAKNIVGDILSFEALSDSTISLMDVNEHRLEQTAAIAEAMVENDRVDAANEAYLPTLE